MLGFKSQPDEVLTGDPASLAATQAELAHWERLNFSFDMDNERPGPSRPEGSRNTRRSRTASQSAASSSASGAASGSNNSTAPQLQDAELLAQFAAAQGIPNDPGAPPVTYESLAQALRLLHGNYPYHPVPPTDFPQNYQSQDARNLPPLPPLPFSWPPTLPPPHNLFQPPPNADPRHNPQMGYPYAGGQFRLPSLPPINTSNEMPRAGPSFTPSPSTRRNSASTPPTTEAPEQMEAERQGSAEDKRRRNTAASARFRIKKKHRTLDLERSVSDLTGRAEELEREAAELRRENGWLKEIVMLKGRNFANEASRDAQQPVEGGSSSHNNNEDKGAEDSEDSEHSNDGNKDKGKGKGKGKGRQK
ncbi:hypothetical protein PLICRDRAFT_35940 [Plicaturopsis crispa FD-325 SS-3]|nr:hypothetical protein PLICRDRAFT_35940 [Plicaturopsis crispa FD-325 SS-3]